MITQDRDWNNSYIERISRFVNEFLSKLWTPEFKSKYGNEFYDINKAFITAIENNIEVITVTQFISREMILSAVDEKFILESTERRIASMLVDSILKSNKVVIRKSTDWYGDVTLECSLPLITFKEIEAVK